jgi:hypothetical protein
MDIANQAFDISAVRIVKQGGDSEPLCFNDSKV